MYDNKKPPSLDDLSAQNRLLVEYMQAGRTLTNHVALLELKIGSLSSRISELRRFGWPVKISSKRDHYGRRYYAYSLP